MQAMAAARQWQRLTWAVHRLQTKLLLLNVKAEHVLFVVLRMTGSLPQVKVVDVWSDNLFVLKLPVHLPDELQQSSTESASPS